jgi:hypothetical protein
MLHTTVQAALERAHDDTGRAPTELFTELLGYPEPARHLGELTAGTDLRHPMPDADPHPLLGALVPDLGADPGTRAAAAAGPSAPGAYAAARGEG